MKTSVRKHLFLHPFQRWWLLIMQHSTSITNSFHSSISWTVYDSQDSKSQRWISEKHEVKRRPQPQLSDIHCGVNVRALTIVFFYFDIAAGMLYATEGLSLNRIVTARHSMNKIARTTDQMVSPWHSVWPDTLDMQCARVGDRTLKCHAKFDRYQTRKFVKNSLHTIIAYLPLRWNTTIHYHNSLPHANFRWKPSAGSE